MSHVTQWLITKVIVRATELNNKNICVLQIGAASLLQIVASAIANWSSYYKLVQFLLEDRAAITN